MTIKKLINYMDKYNPKKPGKIKKFKLKFCGSGAFRNVYKVEKLQVVIKFPKDIGALDHCQREIRQIKKYSKGKTKKFMPTVYWYNKKTGVIVMKLYKLGTRQKIASMKRLFNRRCDLGCYWNLGEDTDGQIKIIDCGLI